MLRLKGDGVEQALQEREVDHEHLQTQDEHQAAEHALRRVKLRAPGPITLDRPV